jgi:6-phosphofructokinase 1
MRRMAVLTSGGDAPGMNAAIRAVVRSGEALGIEILGVRRGFAGLFVGDLASIGSREVSGIIQRGGTILGTARCSEFKSHAAQLQAKEVLDQHQISGLIVIGGNGSQQGAFALSQMGVPVIGVASTIDNDLFGSDIAIGVDTALNIALEAVDRLKTTAESHRRAFLVEVMGRDCGYLAMMTAIAGGAEAVVLPEVDTNPESLAGHLLAAYERGQSHAIVIVAEGAPFNAEALTAHFKLHRDRLGFDLRTIHLGHVQRGGAPGAYDRLLGSQFGARAVDLLASGEGGVLVGLRRGEVTQTPLAEVVANTNTWDRELLTLANRLAR